MREETRYCNFVKRYYSVRHYCSPWETKDYENDFIGAKSQGTIRAAGLNVETNHYFLAYY